MIKLYNNSKLPSILFTKMIKHAMKQLNLEGDVIVLVTKGRQGGGMFYGGHVFKDGRFGHRNWVPSKLGKIIINPWTTSDPLQCAKHIYECVMHEFKHSFDWVNKTVAFVYKDNNGKKLIYSKRPQEISARFFEKYQAKYDDGILLDLAIAIAEIQKENN